MDKFKLVLIIDDNEIDSFVAKMMIENMGITEDLTTVSNAHKAVDLSREIIQAVKAGKMQYEDVCIFLDIQMPYMDGSGFLNILKTMSPSLLDRVFTLSNLNLVDQYNRMKGHNIGGYIVKPLKEEIVEKIIKGRVLSVR